MNNNLRIAIISLLFAVPFIGLIVSTSMFFPYITGKNLIFRLIVEVAAVLYVMLALREPKFRPRITPVVISFLAFLGVLFIANLNAEYPYKAFFSNFERMEGFFTILHLFVYFVVAGAVLNAEKIWRRFFQVSLGASVVVGLIGLNQVAEKDRIDATLGNSTYLGAYTLFHIFIAVFLLARHVERAKKENGLSVWKILTYLGLIVFNLVVFYYTGTRGALLGLVAGGGFISLMFALFEKNKILKTLGIVALSIIVLVVGSLAVFKNSEFVHSSPSLSRFSKLATFDPTALAEFAASEGKARFVIWGIALDGVKERPLLGWGQDNFNYIFNKYYDPAIWNQEQWFDRAHNVFFDWLTEAGILGLLAYLSLFVLGVVSVWRARSSGDQNSFVFSDKVILTGLFIAYFIHNLFVFDNITSYILFFSILAFIYMHEKGGFAHEKISKPVSENAVTAGSIIAAILGAVVLYYCVLVPYISATSLITALTYQNIGLQRGGDDMVKASLDMYKKTIGYNGVGTAEAREQLASGATAIVYQSSASDALKSEFITYTIEQMEAQLKETPHDARYHFFYGLFLYNMSRVAPGVSLEKAFAEMEVSLEQSPRKQAIMLQIATMHINLKQYDKAREYAQKAYETEPENKDALGVYATTLIYLGDNVLADKILEEMNQNTLRNKMERVDYNLMRAYYDTNQKAKISAILDRKMSLAQDYIDERKYDNAVAQIQEVVSIDPSRQAAGEALIAKIQELSKTR